MTCLCNQVGTVATVSKAISLAETSRDNSLALQIMEFVATMPAEGSTKDELRFRLNIAVGQFAEAARDALEMARFEQVTYINRLVY